MGGQDEELDHKVSFGCQTLSSFLSLSHFLTMQHSSSDTFPLEISFFLLFFSFSHFFWGLITWFLCLSRSLTLALSRFLAFGLAWNVQNSHYLALVRFFSLSLISFPRSLFHIVMSCYNQQVDKSVCSWFINDQDNFQLSLFVVS